MEVIKLLVLAGVFFALTPGILVKVPSGGSVLKVAAAHAILFGLVYLVGTYLFQALEEFAVKKLKLAPALTFNAPNPAQQITAAAARAGIILIHNPNASFLSFVPDGTTGNPSVVNGRIIEGPPLPKCPPGKVLDKPYGSQECITMPSKYILPNVSSASLAKTPNGGGMLAADNPNRIISVKSYINTGGKFWCPPGYVNKRDNYGTPGTCIVAPTNAISNVNDVVKFSPGSNYS